MKRTVLAIISCLLLLGVVIAGCGPTDGAGEGAQVGVWPNADYAGINNVLSRMVAGINWTTVEYTGTVDFEVDPDWVTVWAGW